MKRLFIFLTIGLATGKISAQSVGIGTTNPNASAILEIKANDKGFLLPRLSSIERDAIPSPASGLMVYDTNFNSLFLYNGTRWVSIDQTNISNVLTRPNTSYTFSAPQFLSSYDELRGSGTTKQSVSISENLIVSFKSLSTSSVPSTLIFDVNRNGNKFALSYGINQPFLNNGFENSLYCFDADSLEQYIYAVVNSGLFKLNMSNTADAVKIADSLGSVTQIKIMSNNEIVLSSDLNSGSLIKVLQNGTKQIIASTLRFPNYFDVFNNDYYVTGLNALTGTVKKITPAGVVTTILSDIVAPKSIVFDKKSNFVLQSNLTLGANIFIRYDMYNSSGTLVGPVNDDSDNPILTNAFIKNAPLYVDNFNNLVFIHNGVAVSGQSGLFGVWIVKMTKL